MSGPINYIEKGYGLHMAVAEAGHWMLEQNGEWIADDPVAVQAIIDSFDPMPYEQGERIKTLNEEYSAIYQQIYKNSPIDELINYNRQALEARAYLKAAEDARPETPVLSALYEKLTALGWTESFDEFVESIQQRDIANIERVSAIDAVRLDAVRRIQATTTITDAQTVTWQFPPL